MRSYLFALITVVSLAFLSCSSDDDSPGGTGGGQQQIVNATYRITFMPNFTDQTHPTDYPVNAMFKSMVVVAHDNSVKLFDEGQQATSGLSLYAREGLTSELETELSNVDDAEVVSYEIGNDIGPTGTDFIDINITPNNTLISFISKIDPSPDWFVGVNSFNLVTANNTLIDEFEFTFSAYDAGVDAGTTYTAPDSGENGTVQEVSGPPFEDPVSGQVRRFGILKFERTDLPNE